jgi:hypothetical protein
MLRGWNNISALLRIDSSGWTKSALHAHWSSPSNSMLAGNLAGNFTDFTLFGGFSPKIHQRFQ